MGFDLINGTSEFRFNLDVFPKVLKLALCYDWIPLGTGIPSDSFKLPWHGSYLEMCGQNVTPEDADNLADALERALSQFPPLLSDLSEIEIFLEQRRPHVEILLTQFKEKLYIPEGEERSKLLYSIQDYVSKDYLEKFIAFCRTGEGFVIL